MTMNHVDLNSAQDQLNAFFTGERCNSEIHPLKHTNTVCKV